MLRLIVAIVGMVGAGVLARAAWRSPARGRLYRHRLARRFRLPAGVQTWIARALFAAGIRTSPEDAVTIAATATVVAGLLAGAMNPVLAPIAAVGVVVAMPVGVALARGRAQRAYIAALPGFVEVVAAQLRSGHTVSSALADLSERAGPIALDLARMKQRIALGATFDDALARWAQERPVEPVRAVAGAFAVASETGGAAADALDGLARSMRDLLGAQAEASALSAQARLSAVVVGAAPLAYLAFATAADPNSATMLVATSTGRVCLALGLGLDGMGAWWMRRIAMSAT